MSSLLKYDAQHLAQAADGTSIFWATRGEGPPIVLCDGLGCDGFAWTYLQPRLSQNYQVIHFHYRGHGRSGPPEDPSRIGIEDLADDLLCVLDAANVKTAIFIGHSMGTQVLLEVFRKAKGRMRSLVFICGSSGRITYTFHGGQFLAAALPGLLEFTGKHPYATRALWSWIPARLSFHVAQWLGEIDGLALGQENFLYYVKHFTAMDPHLWLQMLYRAGEHSAEDVLGQIHMPTLVFAAEKDTFTPEAEAQKMASQIPGSRYILLPKASHAAPVEQSTLVYEHLETFFKEFVK